MPFNNVISSQTQKENMSTTPTYQFIHSTYWKAKDNSSDAVVALLKEVDTGEPKLHIFQNPKRTVYVTRPGLRETHDHKKLCETLDNLDSYSVHNHNLREELQRILLGHTKGYVTQTQLLNNPYVYGADIDISVLIKQHFLNSTDKMCKGFRVGGLDIETAVPGILGGKEVILITYVTPELKIHTAVLKAFLQESACGEALTLFDSVLSNLKQELNNKGQKVLEKHFDKSIPLGFSPNITFHDSEVDMIKWIFSIIHKDKPEFISIWNIDYDIPFLLDRLRVHDVVPHGVMCHPEVPFKYRVCNYRQDNNKSAQFFHKWHVFELSGYTQFYDSMCLYSRLRKHKGNENSYALDYIAKKVLGTGKLKYPKSSHYVMQSSKQVEYLAYNIMDTLLTVLMEHVIKDVGSLMMLIKDTDFSSFAMQTVQLKNWFYNYLKAHRKVPASWQGKILHETDSEIVNVGGNVLAPGLAWRTGVTRVKELLGIVNDVVSKMVLLVSDLDVARMYPSIMAACNIDRDTKRMTVLQVENCDAHRIVDFMGHLLFPKENAAYLCNQYFNLPSYTEMLQIYDNEQQPLSTGVNI
jgi:hypothetical protein